MIEIQVKLHIYCKACNKSLSQNIEYRQPHGSNVVEVTPCECSSKINFENKRDENENGISGNNNHKS